MTRFTPVDADQAIAGRKTGGKSELRRVSMPGNARSREREGKCNREETTCLVKARQERVKRRGKSPPRLR
jgi:hypothetical protein